MPITLAAVGAKITAALFNAVAVATRAGGRTLIIPASTSGTGISVTALGTIQLSSVNGAVSINGVFNSTYDNYEIVVDVLCNTAAQMTLNLRANASDDTSADQSAQILQGTASTASAVSTGVGTATNLRIHSTTAANEIDAVVALFQPFAAAPTRLMSTFAEWTASAGYAGVIAGRNGSTTSFDGFTLTTTAAMSGTIRVFGINNG